jgi:hypothetical protein
MSDKTAARAAEFGAWRCFSTARTTFDSGESPSIFPQLQEQGLLVFRVNFQLTFNSLALFISSLPFYIVFLMCSHLPGCGGVKGEVEEFKCSIHITIAVNAQCGVCT